MISPHTPPGTLIVCIDDDPDSCLQRGMNYFPGSLDGLTKGVVYTVREIQEAWHSIDGFQVLLEEIRRPGPVSTLIDAECGFALRRFKPAVLPKCLTDALTEQKLLEDA